MVTQRTANPCTPVRFRLGPPDNIQYNQIAIVCYWLPIGPGISEYARVPGNDKRHHRICRPTAARGYMQPWPTISCRGRPMARKVSPNSPVRADWRCFSPPSRSAGWAQSSRLVRQPLSCARLGGLCDRDPAHRRWRVNLAGSALANMAIGAMLGEAETGPQS